MCHLIHFKSPQNNVKRLSMILNDSSVAISYIENVWATNNANKSTSIYKCVNRVKHTFYMVTFSTFVVNKVIYKRTLWNSMIPCPFPLSGNLVPMCSRRNAWNGILQMAIIGRRGWDFLLHGFSCKRGGTYDIGISVSVTCFGILLCHFS